MRKILGLILIATLLVACKDKGGTSKEQRPLPNDNVELIEGMSNLIDSLYKVDQKFQANLVSASQKLDTEKMKELYAAEEKLFESHIPFLKDIYNTIGYPTIEMVGKESSHNFFVLVQHSDSDVKFQEDMLKNITKEVEKGNVQGKDYAYLTDRVQLALQKPQTYGTQLDYNTNIAQVFPKNLWDESNVNARRKEIGLEPIEEYLNKVTKIHFEMNKAHYDKIGITKPKLYKVN